MFQRLAGQSAESYSLGSCSSI